MLYVLPGSTSETQANPPYHRRVSGFTNQIRKQIAVLKELATLVKAGQYTGALGKPDKLAVMGFSFGSYITHYMTAQNPDLPDAAVMTGINYNTSGLNPNGLFRSFVPRVAATQNPKRFGGLDAGYVTWVDYIAQINTYFKYPFYDLPTAHFAEDYKQAFGISEFLTLVDGDLDASNFKGAALVSFL